MAINVTALPNYVDEQRLPLLSKSILGSKTARYITKQTGCKSDTAVNILDTDIAIQSGADCGWTESGSTKLSQRVIKIVPLKVNQAFCDKKLLGKWTSYDVQVASLPEDKRLPFEEYFMNGVADGIAESVEHMIWQGASGSTSEFTGLLTIAKAESDVITEEATQGTAVYTFLKNVYLAMPEAVANKKDAVIFVGYGLFRKFIQELISANLYHYDANDAEGEYMLPGTNCKVIAVGGLDETETYDYAVAGRLSNLFYGVDLENDDEVMDLFYSKDNREHRLACEFVGGTQIAFPEEVVLGKLAK